MKKLLMGILALTLVTSFETSARTIQKNCEALLSQDRTSSQTATDRYQAMISLIDSKALARSHRFKFGFESEFTLDKYANRILEYYAPTPEAGLSSAQWDKLGATPGARINWVRENLDKLFPAHRQEGALKLRENGKVIGFLPESLILDYSGNLELVMPPLSPLNSWEKTTAEIEARMGNGSLQATVGLPYKQFWATQTPQGVSGLLQFFADFDALLKLNQGWNKALENSQKPAAQAFLHPFLGPLTQLKRAHLDRYLQGNLNGQLMDKESMQFVSHADDSWKFSGTTVYRPDIATGKFVVFEIRDAHSNLEFLKTQLLRTLYFVTKSLDPFAEFSAVPAFDSQKDFQKFPVAVQESLAQLFPRRFTDSNETYSDNEVLANEVHRNFAYPLRNWSPWVNAFGQPELGRKVRVAQRKYQVRIKEIITHLQLGQISEGEAKLKAQFAVAEFSERSGLMEAFLQQLDRLLQINAAQDTLKKAS